MKKFIRIFILLLCISLVFIQIKPVFANAGEKINPGESTKFNFSVDCGLDSSSLPGADVVLMHEDDGRAESRKFTQYSQHATTEAGGKAVLDLAFDLDQFSVGNFFWAVKYNEEFVIPENKYQKAFTGNRSASWKLWESEATTLTKVKDSYDFQVGRCPEGFKPNGKQEESNVVKEEDVVQRQKEITDSLINQVCRLELGLSTLKNNCTEAITTCIYSDKTKAALKEALSKKDFTDFDNKIRAECRIKGIDAEKASQPAKVSIEDWQAMLKEDLGNQLCKGSSQTACKEALNSCIDSEAVKQIIEDSSNKKEGKLYDEVLKKCQPQGQPGTGTRTGPKVDPATRLSIHGWAEGALKLQGFEDLKWISVGASFLDSKGECIKPYDNGAVKLTLTKIADAVGKTTNTDIPVNKTPVLEGNLLGEAHAFNRICWSYQAMLPDKVSRAGKYKLDAVFEGNRSYNRSEASTTVTFTDAELIVTKTTITPKPAGKVEGAQAKMEGGRVKIINEPDSADETLVLIPESSVGSGSCNASELPLVHFAVTKVGSDGSVDVVYDNPGYPNCEPWLLPLSQLGDLSQVNRLEATASLPDDQGSIYQPSQGGLVIPVAMTTVETKPYVKLSSDPSVENISFGDSVTIIASTNKIVANPVLQITRNGEENNLEANSSTENCRDKTGNCEYSFFIFQPDGDYKVTFTSGDVSDSLSFSAKSKPAGEISSVGLLVGGEEVPMSLEGGMLDLWLDGSVTNSFLLVIHYTNGSEVRKNLTFDYAQLTSSPTPTPTTGGYYWYCRGNTIIEVDPSGNEREHTDCGVQNKECRMIETPGYQLDAACFTSEQPQEGQTPNDPYAGKPYWECENNNIMEIEADGSRREHTRCGDLEPKGSWYCSSKETPGYKSDADCYPPDLLF